MSLNIVKLQVTTEDRDGKQLIDTSESATVASPRNRRIAVSSDQSSAEQLRDRRVDARSFSVRAVSNGRTSDTAFVGQTVYLSE
jgi:hypothetical protein